MKKPEGIRVVATYACKKNCPFCYQPTRIGGFLDKNKFSKILENLDFMPIYFTFQGGEISYFPEKALELIDIADRYFPQVLSKSLTTNGQADLDFYEKTKLHGISHLTFSLHSVTPFSSLQDKILKLAQDGFFTVRVNCFIDETKIINYLDVIDFCMRNKIQLTLCEDLKFDSETSKYKDILKHKLSPYELEIKEYKHQDIYTVHKWNYRFWVYHHADHYDYNNLIVLPDGTTSMTFDDVLNGKGNIES